MSVPDRSDRRAFELYRHSVEMANIEGKDIERRDLSYQEDEWDLRGSGTKGTPLDWARYDYRLAPEAPAVEPWTFETCPTERIKVREKASGRVAFLACLPDGVRVMFSVFDTSRDYTLKYDTAAELLEQLDGSPCGTVKASEWPKWFGDGGDHVWQVNQDGSGTYYHQGKESGKIGRGGYSDDAALGTLYPQIPQAEAEALIQKARSK